MMPRREKTLFIDNCSSSCGDCGKSADPHEKGHFTLLGYGPNNGTPGCGSIWKYVASSMYSDSANEIVKAMRPDLILVDDENKFAFTAPEIVEDLKRG